MHCAVESPTSSGGLARCRSISKVSSWRKGLRCMTTSRPPPHALPLPGQRRADGTPRAKPRSRPRQQARYASSYGAYPITRDGFRVAGADARTGSKAVDATAASRRKPHLPCRLTKTRRSCDVPNVRREPATPLLENRRPIPRTRIAETIVVYGSTRIVDAQLARRRLADSQRALTAHHLEGVSLCASHFLPPHQSIVVPI